MRKITLSLTIFLLFSLFTQAFGQARPDEKLFQEAKVLMFDEKWAAAQEKIDTLLRDYPNSPFSSQGLFYRAKCLGKQKGKEREALYAFKTYVRLEDASASLVEESQVAIVDLANDLYLRGNEAVLRDLEEALSSSNKAVQYYAAFKLSFIKDKRVAAKSVPILKQIIEKEKDNELKDRARIALLRVAPEELHAFEERREERKALSLNIMFVNDEGKKATLKIPWVLADLALQAIPEKEKAMLRKKGYNLSCIMDDLARGKATIFEIKEGESIIRIWID